MTYMAPRKEPRWIVDYRDVISKLRLALYKFEFDNIDFQTFINEINRALVSHGYDPIKVLISDTMTELFGAYSVYMPSKFVSRIYVSNELMRKPRTLLGRVLMHEVFHHVLFQRPPNLLFRLAPKRTEPLILITAPLMVLAVMTVLFGSINYVLPYIVISSMIAMVCAVLFLIKALNSHELVATALVIYLITGKWISDWTYYHSDEALMNLKWSDSVRPREIVAT